MKKTPPQKTTLGQQVADATVIAKVVETTVQATTVTPAHVQIDHEAVAFYYPEHLPREEDPHYHLFNQARKRVLAAGTGCWICGTKENLELHHSEVEFAAATGVDIERFAELFPEYHITCEEEFLAYVESEGNLLVLCAKCHRGPFNGIHHVVYPNWKLQRFWRQDLPAPVQDPKAATATVTETVTSVSVTTASPPTSSGPGLDLDANRFAKPAPDKAFPDF